ncbi:hypothetical protein MNQ95_14675 [Pseudoxanthomonas daejeonensis]|uniref:DUF6603 domain-containing protein n=1 Tax=Pseudoxanthomonas daejeonensis TaxID=266062 RepID=UPI001F54079F|nr:DUF6603 domain-containing protein [Pseudoxanthomonas daejeonensis]UNK57357.1 hypothetical protein MNQ95_14675 [Pseudoxanthomonas daejeonensis]
MSLGSGDFGVLGNLGKALGIFDAEGDPNQDWFANPEHSLRTILASPAQREALMAFVDEAMGGAERSTDNGLTWLPLLQIEDPPLQVAVTVDERPTEGLHIGLGLRCSTTDPGSATTLAIPLFRAQKEGGLPVEPLLLGSSGGRIRLGSTITLDAAPPVPGQPRLGGVGLEIDLPTSPYDPAAPVFALLLQGLQLPGAPTPRDVRVSADGTDALDDALLDLVLSLVKAQADAAAASPELSALAGLLGLRDGDQVPDFPITTLPARGALAIADWIRGILLDTAARADWLGHLAGLLGGSVAAGAARFDLGGAAQLELALRVDNGPSGNPRLTPSLSVLLGTGNTRVEARADLLRIDLVTGQATALPSLGLWAAAGTPASPLLDSTEARAETLRLGFALDGARRLTFVLAADGVQVRGTSYGTLDLGTPDAVMGAAGAIVSDALDEIADEVLAGLGDALGLVRRLTGLSPPAGVPAISAQQLLADPLAAVADYWRALLAVPTAAASVLEDLRRAIADAAQDAVPLIGDGTRAAPWRLSLAGPLNLEVWRDGDVLVVDLGVETVVASLGAASTVQSRIAARLARIDLANRGVELLGQVEALLATRAQGSTPLARLALADGLSLEAGHAGLRMAWSPAAGLSVAADVPALALHRDATQWPIRLPAIAADGRVDLAPADWDGVEALAGQLGRLAGGFTAELVAVLGWDGPPDASSAQRLRLRDLVDDPAAALRAWLPLLLGGDLRERALAIAADLFSGTPALPGVLAGIGRPDDPYRIAVDPALPELALWFAPEGIASVVPSIDDLLDGWQPGQAGLPPAVLQAALVARAALSADLRALLYGRDVEAALAALQQRWAGGDGRIVMPATAPAGVTLHTAPLSAVQLPGRINLPALLGRPLTTIVHVALGTDAWPDAPAGRRIDLCGSGRDASMFALPAAATGEWYVALGTRAECRGTGGGDGTAGQAERLARWLSTLSAVDSQVVVVAVAGAGHAARVAAQKPECACVTALVTLGTPLTPVSLTALSIQPTADALRLLQRLLPAPDSADSAELQLGRGLVRSMMELAALPDPADDLGLPDVPPPPPRAGLDVRAIFGVVAEADVARALTAIVAAGLGARTQTASPATAIRAGLHWPLPSGAAGTLNLSGGAQLELVGSDMAGNPQLARALHVQVRIDDAIGWIVATDELELRAVSIALTLPLAGDLPASARVVLHDARIYGQSWEALACGGPADAVAAVLPEARVLLAAAMQRLTRDTASQASLALSQLLKALGILDGAFGLVGDALDQFVHDPAGLVRQRMASAGSEVAAAVASLLGQRGIGIDLPARRVYVEGEGRGRFDWSLDLSAGADGPVGQARLGSIDVPVTGGLQLQLDLDPFRVALDWQLPGGGSEAVELWPLPDPQALARMAARAAPGLAAQAAVETMRRADVAVRPVLDSALDTLGMLAGVASDAQRSLRPLVGMFADPVAWLRGSGALATDPVRIQALLDALRPLMGLPGSVGQSLALAPGVTLAVAADSGGARLALGVDSSSWNAAPAVTGRLACGIGATLALSAGAAPRLGLETRIGLSGGIGDRQSLAVALGDSGLRVALRPASGADIALLPFAGLGSLAQTAAESVLPFLLDRIAGLNGTPGDLVRAVGDALALRRNAKFDVDALRAWAADPAAALSGAIPTLTGGALQAIAPLLDDFLPAAVQATAIPAQLDVTVSGVTLVWRPGEGRMQVLAPSLAVPGIETLGLKLAVSAAGLDELAVAVGPARIDAGGVLLRPFASIAAGNAPAGGRRVLLGLSADDTHHFAARWNLDGGSFDVVASDGVLADAIATTDPAQVALRIVDVVADVVAAMAMAQQPVQDLLDTSFGSAAGSDVRRLLQGVLLDDADPGQLIDGLFDPEALLERVQRLFRNIAGAAFEIDAGDLKLAITSSGDGTIGLQVGIDNRFALVEGDVCLWLENDADWIEDGSSDPGGGVFVGLMKTGPLAFTPSLAVRGVGLRVGKSSGPLLDAGISIGSVALHVFANVDGDTAPDLGLQLQFSELAVATSGAQGDNGVAQGIMRDTGPTPPKPAFSPALAIQSHDGGPVNVSLSAGDGAGPWWIGIRRGFGPLYLEQIGFGATSLNGRLERISLLMDGSVSMFGLTCTVDDLQITYFAGNDDFFNPANWQVDLAGLAVSADMAGVSLAGGLLKQTTPKGTEYLGMLLGRFAVYGLTVYGGYGEGEQDGQKFTAFFAIGAVNGPIGGPPAFFLTGIGGGFGINRQLRLPSDLAQFGDYPLIQALDIAASPSDPMTQLRELGSYFPMQRGTFWFAAGMSFNSFALVDGIAVVGVQIGDGLDINLLGLARMALPRPQAALVSIELALMVRFSSSEGVLWVQGQLTDNSWLLYEDVKITGGFAYVIWFKGERAGEFVLSLGGYHPDFHRDGYPVVPRLGLRWSIGSNIVIKAGTYFALTSEALMAGGDFEVSARFGPAWAEVKFGAHGIVFFDPFHYDVSAYARIAAGVTIDTWLFGEITFSINIGARIHVLGPDFRGSATFEIGPIELTVRFGGSEKADRNLLGADAFIGKYLEAADNGKARPHAVMVNTGALPARGEDSTPDGSASRPFVVVNEFSMSFTTTVPATGVARTQPRPGQQASTSHPPSAALGVAPMGAAMTASTIGLAWRADGADRPFPFRDRARPHGSFPMGIWGPEQDPNARKVPKGEMVKALNELDLVCSAEPSGGGPQIAYHQVEIGKRKPLPFSRRPAAISAQLAAAQSVAALVQQPGTTAAAFAVARDYLARTATPTALAALRGERQSPPRVGALTEGLEIAQATTVPAPASPPAVADYDHFIDAPVVVGLLDGVTVGVSVAPRTRTSVKGSERGWRIAPPTLAAVDAGRSRSIAARLTVVDTPALASRNGTVLAANTLPPTAIAHAASASVARQGSAQSDALTGFAAAMSTRAAVVRPRNRRAAAASGATLAAGQTVILKLPNARADVASNAERPRLVVSGMPARVVLLAHGGRWLADRQVGPGQDAASLELPVGTERIIAIGQGSMDAGAVAARGLSGWHAGMQLPYAGWSTAVAPGCVVRARGQRLALHGERQDAGWVGGAELVRGTGTVATTFSGAPRMLLVALDDPAVAGEPSAARQLLLGLDGAVRVRDGASDRPPVLLVMDNRSVLAYDIVADGDRPVVVTIASDDDWSLVGVMASPDLDAKSAIAMIAARGLDAVVAPFAPASIAGNAASSLLAWQGPVRDRQTRIAARAQAGRPFESGATKEPAAKKPSRASPKKSPEPARTRHGNARKNGAPR